MKSGEKRDQIRDSIRLGFGLGPIVGALAWVGYPDDRAGIVVVALLWLALVAITVRG